MPKKVVCPECGQDIPDGQIGGHMLSHWGTCPEKIKYPEAHERFMFLYEAAKERGEVS